MLPGTSPFQRSDFGKLASLSTEGRSTATTVLSLAIVRALRQVEGISDKARKLLSFTDNRQDASLQAEHCNDFIQIGLLRASLYAAVAAAGAEGLGHESIAQNVTEAQGLELVDYASNPEVELLARRRTVEALREVICYQVYRDLRRGWRVTSPNLEQCGLLKVEYEALDELCDTGNSNRTRADSGRGRVIAGDRRDRPGSPHCSYAVGDRPDRAGDGGFLPGIVTPPCSVHHQAYRG